ncbi:enoyl-CoA hydratase/isomerase family protein [Edaphovirga cremea]|jgi:enoyl-CoA hydratase/carnithine racemase|uniref:enoyl-CoA hydratase/isomerase family protein n=1 Tax=Edaphovirga cremea TaxID=2267246 RepID=UPI0039895253
MHEYVMVPIKFNPDLLADFESRFTAALNNEQCHVIVLTGDLNWFSMGMDLDYISTDYEPLFISQFCNILKMVKNSPKPVLARVEGDVIAGGIALMCVADYIISCETVSFSLPESSFGITPTIAMSCLLERITPHHLKFLVWSATAISARKALEWGIVDKISTTETIEQDVRAMSNKLSHIPESIIRESKLLLDWHSSFDKTLDLGSHLLGEKLSDPQIIEKTRHYLECISLFNDEYADHQYEQN